MEEVVTLKTEIKTESPAPQKPENLSEFHQEGR